MRFDLDGNYITNNQYKEIHVLDQLLTAAKIPHTMTTFLDGWQICYPFDGKNRIMDAVEHFGSYGSGEDLLEIMGLLTPEEQKIDSVLGYLTAQDVFKRIQQNYNDGIGSSAQ